VQRIPHAVSAARRGAVRLRGRDGEPAADDGDVGLPSDPGVPLPGGVPDGELQGAESESGGEGADGAGEREAEIGVGEQQLWVSRKCKELIKDLEEVSYKSEPARSTRTRTRDEPTCRTR